MSMKTHWFFTHVFQSFLQFDPLKLGIFQGNLPLQLGINPVFMGFSGSGDSLFAETVIRSRDSFV